eukprot:2565498-Alexandrium_andersonii.AAC.1
MCIRDSFSCWRRALRFWDFSGPSDVAGCSEFKLVPRFVAHDEVQDARLLRAFAVYELAFCGWQAGRKSRTLTSTVPSGSCALRMGWCGGRLMPGVLWPWTN